ncbi:MAG: acylphosphatase [Candidatus Pacebacteria bacterium]|nr:acylphosphatase [Candidatus Paceibacterota bacterium]
MKMVRKIVFIAGKVQNVCFRSKMEEKARKLKVCGNVMNLRDGQVRAVLEGEEESVDRVIEWARRGPKEARVEKLSVFSQPYKAEYHSFRIIVPS